MIASALAAVVLRNRLAATLLVGITGYGCGMLFALYGAPPTSHSPSSWWRP